ncbi:MAG: SNF2-related protein [bacterium]
MSQVELREVPSFVRRRWAEELLLQRSSRTGNRLTRSLEDASIDLLPHQVEAAAFALNRLFSGGAILADEVGLGKTIEAGLVISQLWAENRRKILIIVPAGLRRQWTEELHDHFHLTAEIIERAKWNRIKQEGPDGLFSCCAHGPVVFSYAFAYRQLDALMGIPWDLVVFDEAHRVRNVYQPENRMARSLRDAFEGRCKLLLTATPLQNSLLELFGLVSFVDDRLLGTQYSFLRNYVADSRGWEIINAGDLQQKLSTRMIRTLRRQVAETIRFTRRRSILQEFTPFDDERELYRKVSAFLRREKSASIGSGQQTLMVLLYRKILASSSFAISQTLLRLINRLRAHVEGHSEDRIIAESDDIEDYEEEEESLSSAERAVEEIHQTRLDEFSREEIEEEIAELSECYQLASSIPANAKGEALVRALSSIFDEAQKKGHPEKAVIFTESRRTQRYLYDRLCEAGCEDDIVLLSGDSGDPAERHEIIERFRTNCRLLIATDAGAEGLNLQFCSVVINYDLPWNPQRVEQRIGRCHRYGQRYDVVVLNFLASDNAADRRVYDVLATKFRLFDGVFGASDEPLGALESSVAFERRVLDIYQSCRTPEEINEAFDQLQNNLGTSLRTRLVEARSLLVDRFDDEVQKRFRLMGEQVRMALDRDSRVVKALICSLFPHRPGEEEGEWILDIPERYMLSVPGVEPGMRVAFGPTSRHETGVVNLSPGHPLVDEAIREVREIEPTLPPLLRLRLCDSGEDVRNLPGLLGRGGWWFLYKIAIHSLEDEEHLVDVILVEESGSPRILSIENSETFWAIAQKTVPVKKAVPQPDSQIIALAGCAAQSRADAIETEIKAWCEKEIESRLEVLDAFVDAELMEAQAGVEKLREQLRELRTRKRDTEDTEKRLRLRPQVTAMETRLLKEIQKTNEKIEQRITENRKIRTNLEKQSRTTSQLQQIAVARWELVWD